MFDYSYKSEQMIVIEQWGFVEEPKISGIQEGEETIGGYLRVVVDLNFMFMNMHAVQPMLILC